MKKTMFWCIALLLCISQCTKTIIKYVEKYDPETLIVDSLDASFYFVIPYPPYNGSLRLNDTVAVDDDIIFTTNAYIRRQSNCCTFDLFLIVALKNGDYMESGLIQCSKYDTVAPASGYYESEKIFIHDTSDQAIFICFYNQLYGKIETQILEQNIRSPFCKSDGTMISDTVIVCGSYRILVKRKSDGSRIIS